MSDKNRVKDCNLYRQNLPMEFTYLESKDIEGSTLSDFSSSPKEYNLGYENEYNYKLHTDQSSFASGFRDGNLIEMSLTPQNNKVAVTSTFDCNIDGNYTFQKDATTIQTTKNNIIYSPVNFLTNSIKGGYYYYNKLTTPREIFYGKKKVSTNPINTTQSFKKKVVVTVFLTFIISVFSILAKVSSTLFLEHINIVWGNLKTISSEQPLETADDILYYKTVSMDCANSNQINTSHCKYHISKYLKLSSSNNFATTPTKTSSEESNLLYSHRSYPIETILTYTDHRVDTTNTDIYTSGLLFGSDSNINTSLSDELDLLKADYDTSLLSLEVCERHSPSFKFSLDLDKINTQKLINELNVSVKSSVTEPPSAVMNNLTSTSPSGTAVDKYPISYLSNVVDYRAGARAFVVQKRARYSVLKSVISLLISSIKSMFSLSLSGYNKLLLPYSAINMHDMLLLDTNTAIIKLKLAYTAMIYYIQIETPKDIRNVLDEYLIDKMAVQFCDRRTCHTELIDNISYTYDSSGYRHPEVIIPVHNALDTTRT